MMPQIGGWWRLWLVISIPLGVLAWVAASNHHDITGYASEMNAVQAQRWVDEAKRRVHVCSIRGHEPIEAVSYGPSESFTGSYYCTSDRQYILSFLYALLPGAVIAALGLTTRWVYRGFRRTPAQNNLSA